MKILIISQYYDPEPVYIPATVARGLADLGHAVTVITGFPNYPGGSLYSGYRQRARFLEADGQVRVLRTPLWISHSKNPIGRIANYLSFALSSLVNILAIRDIDVVYVYSAQMTAAFGPSVRRLLMGTPYVMHIQDLWPESVTGSSMIGNGRLSRIVGAVLRPWLGFLYRQASATIAIAPTMAKMLVDRGVPTSRIRMVYNWANEKVKVSVPASSELHLRAPRDSNEVLVVYAGNLGDHQDLETVIRAAKSVENEIDLRLELYGAGVAEQRLEALASQLEVGNITFCGSVSAGEIKNVYASADFQLISLLDREIFRGTIPSKLQAALFNGSAVMSNVSGDVADICSTYGLGLTCEPGSVTSMADMFRRGAGTTLEERQRMTANGRAFYQKNMSMDEGIHALEKILFEAENAGKSK